MQFEEVMVYTILGLLSIAVLFGVFNLIYNSRILRRFSGKYMKIIANYELQSKDLSSLFTVTYFNNNMADIKVHSFGFMYCNEQVDFYEEYVKTYLPDLKKRMLIETSESVKLQITYERMKNMLLSIRSDRASLKPIYGYIIDSNGNQSIKKLKDVHKNVKRIFKAELKAEADARKETIRLAKVAKKERKVKEKAEKKLKKQKIKEEKKLVRNKKRLERKQKRQEAWTKLKDNLKKFFANVNKGIKTFFGKIKNIFTKKKESD